MNMDKLVDEIRAFFPEFKITVNDLKTPNSLFVTYFYVRVLSELGIDVENVQRVQMNQLGSTEEGFEIIAKLNLVTAVRTAFPFLNFTLSDLLSPDFKRNTRLFRDVMKFLQFCEARCAANNIKVEKYQEAKYFENELKITSDKESNALNALALELDTLQQSKIGLQDNIAMLEKEIMNFREVIEQSVSHFQKVKETLGAKESKIQNLKSQINELVAEYEDYRQLIVQNPDEEKRQFEIKSKERERVIENKKEYHDKYMALTADIEILLKEKEKFSRKLAPVLSEIHILQEYSDLKNKNLNTEATMSDLQKKIDELTKEKNELDQKINQAEQSSTTKLDDFEGNIISLRNALLKKKSDRKVMDEGMKQYYQDLDRVMSFISNLEQEYDSLLTSYKNAEEILFAKAK